MPSPTLIIDFDSTFVTLESLDELARIALVDSPRRQQILKELSAITELGMEGKIGFGESLQLRLKMFQANRQHIEQLIELLNANITASMDRHRDFFRDHSERIYIISGGFTDYIWPVTKDFGLKPDHILANRFTFNAKGEITGCDGTCFLAQDNGKVKQVAALDLQGPIYVIGDGYTDYQLRASGAAQKFLAFVENIHRPAVVANADAVLASFDEVVTVI